MSQQNWNPSEYKKHASFVPTMANDVVGLLAPKEGEVILDIGCGDGELTQKIQEKGCSVIGIDSSASMIETAKNRGIEAYVIDGHNIPYQNKFDAVFSNAALHWLTQPEKAIRGAYLALKENGRFVAEFGGKGNIATLLKAMQEVFEENADFGQFHMPWYFPSVKEYQELLEQAGFHVKYIELIPRPTPLKSGVEKWLEIFADGITNHLSQEQKTTFLGSVKDKLLFFLIFLQNKADGLQIMCVYGSKRQRHNMALKGRSLSRPPLSFALDRNVDTSKPCENV